MKISTEIGSIAQIVGEEKAIEYCAKAGFDAWDFSMFDMCKYDWAGKCILENNHPLAGENYRKFAKNLRKVAEANGIHCNQAHAPFPIFCKEIYDHMERALECAAIAGAEICVIHPDNYKTAAENAEIYRSLLPIARSYGVKIACENMWCWDGAKDESTFAACATAESFLEHFNLVNDDFFTICLDIGHAEMKGSGQGAANMIRALGEKITALHIHDNDKWHDSHQIPFTMNIDFEEIISALQKVNYSGYFTLEANRYLKDHTAENVFDGVCTMQKAAKRLSDMFEGR